MKQMIEVAALENGAHRNQTYHGTLPKGWAIVPEGMELPATFPFVEVTAEEIDGVLTVTDMAEGVIPEPTEPTDPPEAEPTVDERLDALERSINVLTGGIQA